MPGTASHPITEAQRAILVAFEHVAGMDEHDSELKTLGYALCHCTRAIVTALEGRDP